jgi:hypothetical protein
VSVVFVFERPIIRVEASGKVMQTLKDQPPLTLTLLKYPSSAIN